MRRALRQHTPAIYTQGIGGVGKSALAAKLLERPGAELDGALVNRCHELPLPADGLTKLANFWQGPGREGHAEAAALLLDSRRDPARPCRPSPTAATWWCLTTWSRGSSPPLAPPAGGGD